MIPSFRMSLNGRCLAEGFGEGFKKLKKVEMELCQDVFHPAGTRRKYVRVESKGTEYWADAVTGSLFDVKTGACQTNSSCLKLPSRL
jgi:hypothetical protein